MADLCIALDAMGGDFGPSVVIPAAIEAVSRFSTLKLVLVGKRDKIEKYLNSHGAGSHPRLSIVEAEEVVQMDDPPAIALRSKRNSSMRIAINLVNEGTAQAAVSAGNTGALMAIARFVLKTLPGVDRPAIVNALPTMKGFSYVLDLGANVDCAPEHLFQFAVMGSVLAKAAGNPNPSVALLNVGSEAIKGSEQVKNAAELLNPIKKEALNYIGFVEGDDIFKGTADVIVCDGFVGNITLKAIEGVARMIMTFTKEEYSRGLYSKLGALLSLPILKRLKHRFDPGQYNGASLLGLRGIVIKSHGKADSHAFCMAIQAAILEIEKNVPEKIQTEVSAFLNRANSNQTNLNHSNPNTTESDH